MSRKKRAPNQIPIPPALLEEIRAHRQRLVREQHPGLAAGWMFPSSVGSLISGTASLKKAREAALKAAGIKERFTVQGFRRTFNDITRRAKVDPLVIKALTGHVTEDMREHYSTVDLAEKRQAVEAMGRRLQFPSKTLDETLDEAGRA